MEISKTPVNITDLNHESARALRIVQGIDKLVGSRSTLSLYVLYLGKNHPTPVAFQELIDLAGIHKSQISRTTRTLHKIDANGQPGADLVDVTFDLANPRLKLVNLNERGVQALSGILK